MPWKFTYAGSLYLWYQSRKRTIFPELPPRIEYSITPLGRSLFSVIDLMRQWGLKRMKQEQRLDQNALLGEGCVNRFTATGSSVATAFPSLPSIRRPLQCSQHRPFRFRALRCCETASGFRVPFSLFRAFRLGRTTRWGIDHRHRKLTPYVGLPIPGERRRTNSPLAPPQGAGHGNASPQKRGRGATASKPRDLHLLAIFFPAGTECV